MIVMICLVASCGVEDRDDFQTRTNDCFDLFRVASCAVEDSDDFLTATDDEAGLSSRHLARGKCMLDSKNNAQVTKT